MTCRLSLAGLVTGGQKTPDVPAHGASGADASQRPVSDHVSGNHSDPMFSPAKVALGMCKFNRHAVDDLPRS